MRLFRKHKHRWVTIKEVFVEHEGTNFEYRIGIQKCICVPSCDKFNFNVERYYKKIINTDDIQKAQRKIEKYLKK